MAKLLLVDDDVMILKLYRKYFEKHFEVTTAKSAIEALELIKQKYTPEVVLSDHLMPDMNGADFLNKLSSTHPTTIRIIMTSESEPSKIIPIFNHAKAHMFLIKPIKELDLVQAVKLAFKQYNLQLQNELLIKKLKEQNTLLSKEISRSFKDSQGMMFDVILNLKTFRGNYFYNHFEGVLKISNFFINDLKLSESSKQEILRITLFYELMMINFPSRIAYKIPFLLEENDKNIYIEYFNSFLEKLEKHYPIKSFSQIWEHADGSGIPNQLKIDKITIESQIFQLSNIYFHFLYELPNQDFISRFLNQKFKYRYEIAFEKMKKGQRYILENIKWFHEDLINSFRFAIKENKVDTFLPVRENMEVTNLDYYPDFEAMINEFNAMKEREENAPEIVSEGDQSFVVKSLHPHQLAIGMIINQNLVTTGNVPVARIGTKITGNLLDNIINLFEKKLLKDAENIEVKIPL